MEESWLQRYKEAGLYTYAGLYAPLLQRLPDDIPTLVKLVKFQTIHRVSLWRSSRTRDGGEDSLAKKVPFDRLRCEDDLFPTATAMLAEIYRRNSQGFILDRPIEEKLIITCRSTSVLLASILKSKGIACRVRAGYAAYLAGPYEEVAWDHWIVECYNSQTNQWVGLDASPVVNEEKIETSNLPSGGFISAPKAWLDIRKEGRRPPSYYKNTCGITGWRPAMWTLFYDLHSLIGNSEMLYTQVPNYVFGFKFVPSEEQLAELDELATLMLDPDSNYTTLRALWDNTPKFRTLSGGLITPDDHIPESGKSGGG